MTWSDWIPAITSSMILSVVGFIAGTYYKAKVEKSVAHNLAVKLEELKAKLKQDEETFKTKLRQDEESFKAAMRIRDDQLAALRSGALAGMAGRQALIDKRRLEAVENLWAAVVERMRLKVVAAMMQPFKMDKLFEEIERGGVERDKIRRLGEMLWEVHKLDDLKFAVVPEKDRPFLPPLVWALYKAYSQALYLPYAQLAAMKTGVGRDILADPTKMLDMIRTALPHQDKFIDQYGAAAIPYLIDDLEERLFNEVVASLNDTTHGATNIQQAAEIVKKSNEIAKAMEGPVLATAR